MLVPAAASGDELPNQEASASSSELISPEPVPAPKTTQEPGPESTELTTDSPTEDVIPPVAEHIFEIGMDRGFTGQVTDYEARKITVYWKGTAPQDVRDYIDSQPLGVTITLDEGAKYSRVESQAARDRIVNNPIATVIGLVSASAKNEWERSRPRNHAQHAPEHNVAQHGQANRGPR